MQAKFHTEVSDGRIGHFLLLLHIVKEVGIYLIEAFHEVRIIFQGLELAHGDRVEQEDRVLMNAVPLFGVNTLEELFGLFVPAPPKVFGQFLEGFELLRSGAVYDHTTPERRIDHTRLLPYGCIGIHYRKVGQSRF